MVNAAQTLVLSLFSGIGSLDEGFRRAGYCVLSAGDVCWGSFYDIGKFHPPSGVFEGVIGGDPCQSHSALANLVRAKGLEPSFPDMTPELSRVIEEAQPAWFLRENVPRAPEIKPAGYTVASFLLDNSTLDRGDGTGHEQMRRRQFWFGMWGDQVPELRANLDFALHVLPELALCVDAGHDKLDGGDHIEHRRKALCADPRASFIPGGQAEVNAIKRQTVTGRHTSATMGGDPESTPGNKPGTPARYSIDEMLDLQGLPLDIFKHSPMTMQGKRKLIGNAVPLPMAEALGRAVCEVMR